MATIEFVEWTPEKRALINGILATSRWTGEPPTVVLGDDGHHYLTDGSRRLLVVSGAFNETSLSGELIGRDDQHHFLVVWTFDRGTPRRQKRGFGAHRARRRNTSK